MAIALAFLVAAKLANVGVPLVLKELVDGLRSAGDRRRAGGAGGAARWPTACCACRPRCSPSCATWCSPGSRSARSARVALRGVPPPARAVAALPPRAPDRRHDARHRARHARHRQLADLRTRSTASCPTLILRSRWCCGVLLGQVRLAGSPRSPSARWSSTSPSRSWSPSGASQFRRADERARLDGQHARHRQPAQLRDRQVLRQRGVRGAALRREPASATSNAAVKSQSLARRCSTSASS